MSADSVPNSAPKDHTNPAAYDTADWHVFLSSGAGAQPSHQAVRMADGMSVTPRMADIGGLSSRANPTLMDAVDILVRNSDADIRDAVRLMVPPGEEFPPHLK